MFQLARIEAELSDGGYSVAHFATHGEFSQDHEKSFILTYDDRLTLDGLQEVLGQRDQSQPLDLLVLSACKTAAGDDRAALGLAGVAVQSGAQSALASLWYISDAATAELIASFYTALQLPENGKAESLRLAQLELLKTERFNHPSFWAPYLLVGNWL
jgi:CHAT domain-containing protein